MTTPTEAEIRAYLESLPPETWAVDDEDAFRFAELGPCFGMVENDRIRDDDFGVWHDAAVEEIRTRLPAIAAAIRPLIIEAQVRALVRFFEHYPDAPLAKREPVPA